MCLTVLDEIVNLWKTIIYINHDLARDIIRELCIGMNMIQTGNCKQGKSDIYVSILNIVQAWQY